MLKALYDNQEDIPAEFASLFTERNGKWEIQVEGIKTPGDTERLQRALDSEREAHRETRGKLRNFDWVGDMSEDGLQTLRDENEDLKAHNGSGPSKEEIDEMVEKRAETKVERALRKPLKMIEDLRTANNAHVSAIGLHEAAGAQRTIRDHVEEALNGKDAVSVAKGAMEDIVPFALRVMNVNDRGEVVTRENAGVTPGISFSELITDMKTEGKRPHWFVASQGAGASGSEGPTGPTGNNPFSAETFNMTEASKIVAADRNKALILCRQAKRQDLIAIYNLDKK
jgi:hypothetical protein